MTAVAASLPGHRLHLQHGPIDLVIGCDGSREAAFAAAQDRFAGLLEDLMTEYPLLVQWNPPRPEGAVAQSMWRAVQRYPGRATPMAAVAGAVADHVLGAMAAVPGVRRAYVNNGGDIALHLTAGNSFRVAMAGAGGRISIAVTDPVRGIATSGQGGRSLSLGIADSVTVLACDAATADAAATLIANAVDLPGHPAIRRAPAQSLRAESDLGMRPVVVGVGHLDKVEISDALAGGADLADKMRKEGHIVAAALHLRGETRLAGAGPFIQQAETEHA